MSQLKIVGLDPSLRNWGMISATFDLDLQILSVQSAEVIQPELSGLVSAKQNILDLESASQLYAGALALVRSADVVFVELPTGSQSSRASLGSGICIGVLGALKLSPMISMIAVSPAEVKRAGFGTINATKKQMIEWAVAKHPEVSWPRYKSKGESVINEGKAEHMCDALAAIYAGMKKCPQFFEN